MINTLRMEQKGHHFVDILKCIFLTENHSVLIQLSIKFAPKDPIDKNSSLVQVMVSQFFGTKSLPIPMMTQFTDTLWWHSHEFRAYSDNKENIM